MLKIDPSSGDISTFGRLPGRGCKWIQGVYDPATACIYGIPGDARSVLRINPSTGQISTTDLAIN